MKTNVKRETRLTLNKELRLADKSTMLTELTIGQVQSVKDHVYNLYKSHLDEDGTYKDLCNEAKNQVMNDLERHKRKLYNKGRLNAQIDKLNAWLRDYKNATK